MRLMCRHSHRDLLKTANTVVDMRGILEEAEAQARRLMRFDSAAVEGPPKNAERFARDFDGMGFGGRGLELIIGRELKIASAVGFVKACLDVVQSEESLVLGAKANLAARLALNTLPKVPTALDIETYRRIHSRTFKFCGIGSPSLARRCLSKLRPLFFPRSHLNHSKHMPS